MILLKQSYRVIVVDISDRVVARVTTYAYTNIGAIGKAQEIFKSYTNRPNYKFKIEE